MEIRGIPWRFFTRVIDLHFLPVESCIIYKILLLVYKPINGFSSSYVIIQFAQFL